MYEEKFKKICPNYPYMPSIYPKVNRIIVIPDLHGDLEYTMKLLKIGKVIGGYDNHWIGGDTFVVQVGDQLDDCREPDLSNRTCGKKNGPSNTHSDIEVIIFLYELNLQAIKKGGRVIMNYGNHELKNIEGQMENLTYDSIHAFDNYVDPDDETKKFNSALEARKYAFSRGHEYAKLIACTHNAIVIIGSNIFAHGGIIKSMAKKLGIADRDGLNNLDVVLREWVYGLTKTMPKFILDENGPFWDRTLSKIPKDISIKDDACKIVAETLNIFKVDKIFIGHTPQDKIKQTCDGKLNLVDTALSRSFQLLLGDNNKTRQPQIIEINDDNELTILE